MAAPENVGAHIVRSQVGKRFRLGCGRKRLRLARKQRTPPLPKGRRSHLPRRQTAVHRAVLRRFAPDGKQLLYGDEVVALGHQRIHHL